MSAIHEPRESFYRCTYSAGGLERIGHVRAWDEVEAESLFRAELDADGVSGKAGTVDVVRLGAQAVALDATRATRARIARRRSRSVH